MKYIDAIQKETIRMYGPTNHNFPRKVLKDFSIDGVTIRSGTVIQYHSVPSHYNPEIFKNPFEFNPERWFDEKLA